MKAAFAILLLVLFTSCCTQVKGPAIITSPVGVRLCAKHHIPLVTAQGFRLHTAPGMHVDPDIKLVERVERCYPNAIPWYEWLGPGHGGDPATITYCPECERGAQHLRR